MEIQHINSAGSCWTGFQKFSFRVFFIFFILMVVPSDSRYYSRLFTTDWTALHIRDIGSLSGSSFKVLQVATKRPGSNDTGGAPEKKQFSYVIYPKSGEFGFWSYINWMIAFGLAILGAILWTCFDRKASNYRRLYYFISVLVSYAMIARLQGLTFSKIFPSQMPDLALTQLNTPFGDFVAQKLYWLQFSFVPNFERYAGWAELAIMLLLFFRKTRGVGAALSIAMIGVISIANHAYDGGIHLLASFFVLGGLFVLWPYLPSIWNLVYRQQNAVLPATAHRLSQGWQKGLRILIKGFLFFFFFVVSGYLHYQNFRHDSYKVPQEPGLPMARGLYSVTAFSVNGRDLPVDPTDSLRWQDVTLEQWSTISFSVNNRFDIHAEAGRGKQYEDIDRTYESAGTGGGRRHFYYQTDASKHRIVLRNKNKLYQDQLWVFDYVRPDFNQIILTGSNEYGQRLRIVLKRRQKAYVLYQHPAKAVLWTP